jgi:hypothetical protein
MARGAPLPMRQESTTPGCGGLGDGTLQTIGTDHCPFFMMARTIVMARASRSPERNGHVDFTRSRMAAWRAGSSQSLTYGVRAGRSRQLPVALNSTNPARIFGLYPRKGALLPVLMLTSSSGIQNDVKHGIGMTHHRQTTARMWLSSLAIPRRCTCEAVRNGTGGWRTAGSSRPWKRRP